MSTYDILSDLTPHGTVAGFEAGCRTNHCPAVIACHVVRTRYFGDYQFRKRVDAGWTAGELAVWDAEQTAAAAAAEKAARRAEHERKRKPKSLRPKDKPTRAMNKRPWTDADIATLSRMNADGAKDAEIAATLGRSRGSINDKRRALRISWVDRRTTWPNNSKSPT